MCRRPEGTAPGFCRGGCCSKCGSPGCVLNQVAWNLRPPLEPNEDTPVEILPLPLPGKLWEPLIVEALAFASDLEADAEDPAEPPSAVLVATVAVQWVRRLAEALEVTEDTARDEADVLGRFAGELRSIADTLSPARRGHATSAD